MKSGKEKKKMCKTKEQKWSIEIRKKHSKPMRSKEKEEEVKLEEMKNKTEKKGEKKKN